MHWLLYWTDYYTDNLFYLQPNIRLLHNVENDDVQAEPSHKKEKMSTNNETYLWHLWLGHINQNRIKRLVKDDPFNLLEVEPLLTCESCLEGKITKKQFIGKGQRVQEYLELVYTDVCRPLNVQARGDFEYMFANDHSRYGYIYLMHHKSKTSGKFRQFKSKTEKQLSKTIKALRSDRGGEYLSREFLDFLTNNGILTQLTPPGTPQLNGVVENAFEYG